MFCKGKDSCYCFSKDWFDLYNQYKVIDECVNECVCHTHTHTCTHIRVYISIYIKKVYIKYIYIYARALVCVCIFCCILLLYFSLKNTVCTMEIFRRNTWIISKKYFILLSKVPKYIWNKTQILRSWLSKESLDSETMKFWYINKYTK